MAAATRSGPSTSDPKHDTTPVRENTSFLSNMNDGKGVLTVTKTASSVGNTVLNGRQEEVLQTSQSTPNAPVQVQQRSVKTGTPTKNEGTGSGFGAGDEADNRQGTSNQSQSSDTIFPTTKAATAPIRNISNNPSITVSNISTTNANLGTNDKASCEQEAGKQIKDDVAAPMSKALSQSSTESLAQSSISQPPGDIPSFPEPPDDPDSEDEEFHSLVAGKKKQIHADIVAFQRRMELELVIFEKRLREELARKKRRKAQQAAGGSGPQPSSKNYGAQPQSTRFLPLLDGIGDGRGIRPYSPSSSASSPSQTTPTRSLQQNSFAGIQPDTQTNTENNSLKSSQSNTPSPTSKNKKSISPSHTPPRAPSPPRTSQTTPPPVSPSSSARQSPIPARLSIAAIKELNSQDKPSLPLPSSLRSNASWGSASGKHSRKSSLVDNKNRPAKRVIFQLTTQDGDWLKIRPDGEEIPLSDEEKDKLRDMAAATEEMEEAERLGNRGDLFGGPLMRSGSSDAALPSPILSKTSRRPLEAGPPVCSPATSPIEQLPQSASPIEQAEQISLGNQDWVLTPKPGDLEASLANILDDSFSDDSGGDDVFDLDEEIPLGYSSTDQNFTMGSSMEDSLSTLELPLAPVPPTPPGGSAMSPSIFGIKRTNSDNIRGNGVTNPSNIFSLRRNADYLNGSYISGSLPLSSYSLVNPMRLHDPYPNRTFGTIRRESMQSPPRRPSSAEESVKGIGLGSPSNKSLVRWQNIPTAAASDAAGSLLSPSFTSNFRRRSVSKYVAGTEDEDKTAVPTGESSETAEPPVSASDNGNKQSATPVPERKVKFEDTEAGILSSRSPYGQSAPIAMTQTSPALAVSNAANFVDSKELPAVKQASFKDSPRSEAGIFQEKPILNGGTNKTKQSKGIYSLTSGSINPLALEAILDEDADAPGEQSVAQTASLAINVETVLKATTEALVRNSLPSSLNVSKAQKATIGAQWDAAHDSFGHKNLEVAKARKDPPNALSLMASNLIVQQFPITAQPVSDNGSNNSQSALSPFGPSFPSSQFYTQNPVTNTVMNTKLPRTPSPTSRRFPNSDRERMVIPVNSPPYSSDVARRAAESTEVDVDESIIGGLDGGTGLDATNLRRASVGFAKTGNLAKSLEKSGVKPQSMSFNLRMALEDH